MAFTRLNTIEILDGAKFHLDNSLMPQLQSETGVVLAQIIGDLLGVVQRRIENEPQWLAEESDIMLGLLEKARAYLQPMDIDEAKDALAAIEGVSNYAAPDGYDALSLSFLQQRYSEVTRALDKVIRALGFANDEASVEPLVGEIQQYLVLRSDRELVIAGNDPPRGRG